MRRRLLALVPLTASALAAAPLKTLPNGLRYVIVEDHTAPVVSMQIWVRCGGVNEEGPSAGVSHFLEHMIFKGTDKISANEISRVVESRGGSLNAATGGETTHYYIDMPSDGFDAAFPVLAESVVHPSFPPAEFEKERLVILEEIKRRNDDPQSDLWDTFLEVLYRQTPYKQQVIGSEASIKAMTRDIMVRQHTAYYVPQNMVVVVAGDVKASRVDRRIKDLFGPLPRSGAPKVPDLYEPPLETALVRRVEREAKQAHVALGFVGPTLGDPRQVAMDVLSTVLGGGQSSPLYQKLREQERKVWSVGASFITHAGSGAFGVFAECPPEKARGLPADVYFVLNDASDHGFSSADVERAKTQIESSWLFSQETYHGQASQWGFYTVLGHPEVLTGYLRALKKVTPRDVSDLLGHYFGGRELSGVIVTPRAAEHKDE
jgi:zinc protease